MERRLNCLNVFQNISNILRKRARENKNSKLRDIHLRTGYIGIHCMLYKETLYNFHVF